MVGNTLFTLSNFHPWDALIVWCYLNPTPLKSSKDIWGIKTNLWQILVSFYKKNRWNIWDKVFKFTAWFIWFTKVTLLRFYQLFQKARASTKKTSLVIFCLTGSVRFFGLGNFWIKYLIFSYCFWKTIQKLFGYHHLQFLKVQRLNACCPLL